MPDETLTRIADRGELSDPDVLLAQVDRMLDDRRSRTFTKTFIGQWLGTKDVGGRVAPTINSIQHFYTPEIASDMREEAVLLFDHIVREDRSVLELLQADYTFLTERLAEHYGLTEHKELELADLEEDAFRRVDLQGKRIGGVLGLGGVLALTSHTSNRETSPVLRGAWVHETLLGTPVPSPPPDIPPLQEAKKKDESLTIRQVLQKHREDPACFSCHQVIDPIGFSLENFDFLGRWRDKDDDGHPVDATAELPSGETFEGPEGLTDVLLERKSEFLRQLSRKVLGYALGRSLVDQDQGTIERLVNELPENDYRARTLVRAVVMSTPFRYKQRVEFSDTADADQRD